MGNAGPVKPKEEDLSSKWVDLEQKETGIPATVGKNGGPFGCGGVARGGVAPGWEGLRAAFELPYSLNQELGSQLCIYEHGVCVVDLHGFSGDKRIKDNYSADTLQTIYSSGKQFEVLVMAMLVDRGLINYEDLVSKHWPNFAQHGKEQITIEMVMRHEAGLTFFADPEAPDDLKRQFLPTIEDVLSFDGIDQVIEKSAPFYGKGEFGSRSYHAETRGFILNGIVRRITGNTLGDFVQEEICKPLGITCLCGRSIEAQKEHHIVDIHDVGKGYSICKEILPAACGCGGNQFMWQFMKNMDKLPYLKRMTFLAEVKEEEMTKWYNTDKGRTAEVPSACMMSNARSMAKVSALFANGGEIDGVRLLKAETVELSRSEPTAKFDFILGMQCSFSKGGHSQIDQLTSMGLVPIPEAPMFRKLEGWHGAGGSLMYFNKETNIGFAYCMNGLLMSPHNAPRTMPIIQALYNKMYK